MAARNEVTLTWIPAHSAIYGNTLADNIAKFAADEIVLGPEPIIAINRSLGKKQMTNGYKKRLRAHEGAHNYVTLSASSKKLVIRSATNC